jgi:hypothetical protein
VAPGPPSRAGGNTNSELWVPPSACCLLPSAFCLLPSAFCFLPFAFCLPRFILRGIVINIKNSSAQFPTLGRSAFCCASRVGAALLAFGARGVYIGEAAIPGFWVAAYILITATDAPPAG